MQRFLLLFLMGTLVVTGCTHKYTMYRNKYDFKSTDGNPVYQDLDYWAAHPWKWDPSDSTPAPLRAEVKDSLADVFFLYPTSYTKKIIGNQQNAPIDNVDLNTKTDYTSILYQASAFNQHARIFAPRYRQAHISNFFRKEKDSALAVFEMAYADVKLAFEYYLAHWNNQRPIIIASHSQGSLLAERLLKDFFEDKPLHKQLVAAYILGWPVPRDYYTSLKLCDDSLATGCLVSWRTVRKGFTPYYLKNEQDSVYVTNPLNWRTDNSYAPRNFNTGSVLLNFNKLYRHTTDAKIENGLLSIKKPKFPGGFFFFTRNYHVADVNLFYMNIRGNVATRITQFLKTVQH